MVGLILLPSPSVLGLLFVHPSYQRRGIALSLWSAVREFLEFNFREGRTVKLSATPNSLPFYQAMGFAPTSPEVTIKGCQVTHYTATRPPSAAIVPPFT